MIGCGGSDFRAVVDDEESAGVFVHIVAWEDVDVFGIGAGG